MKDENENKYDDIINLQRPKSSGHPPMSMHDRAAQFSPFAALTGHSDAVSETARRTEKMHELDENTVEILNAKLNFIAQNIRFAPEISVVYFAPDRKKEGGAYISHTGVPKKIDEYEHNVVFTDGTVIQIDKIAEINSNILPDF